MLSLKAIHGRAGPALYRGAAWVAAAGLPGPAQAQPGIAGAAGPWIFGSVALLLVAVLAWLAGRRWAAAARPDEPQAHTAQADARGEEDGSTLQALCNDLGSQIRLLRPVPADPPVRGGSGWQLVAACPPLPAGSEPFDGLPLAVTLAVRQLGPGAASEIEGWHAAVHGAGAAQRLVLRQTPAPAAVEDPAAFSFTVSHDLRAPVRVVEGFARILKEDYGRQLDRIGNDHLDRVLAAAARMNAMIDAMLSMARLSSQPIAHQSVNLSQLAGFVIDDLRRSSPDRCVQAQVEPGLHAVGDPTLLRQVLENLIANAWKYTARCEQAQLSFTTAERDGKRVFEIRDNGAGFDMRSAQRLFGLFQRLHSAADFPGTGVGLASVKRIVHRHGGEIWAEAEPGQGARFYFTLPG